ncbi:MAG: hypothetical protein KJ566_01145 [Nanoarchaeota archaeon]|nr:hypothetical protein [Nanoarchaeota archaeon]
MPICGFNEKMLKGLIALTEGLVEHGLVYRCKKNRETIEQGIKREISDMARLIPELHRIDDSAKRILTEGIVKYAQGFYMLTRKTGIENYKENIGKIMNYFKFMDEKYYGELEGQPDDMKDLTKFLNEKEI